MYIIFHNPLSNPKQNQKILRKVEAQLKKQYISFKIKNVLDVKDIKAYLDQFKDIKKIILIGGDGTIHYFYKMLQEANVKEDIYLYPAGTGNDFSRTLKKHISLDVTVSNVLLNNKEENIFINGCGIGLDGKICENKEKKNSSSFLRTSLNTIKNFTPVPATITVDTKEYKYNKVYFVSIQNGKYFGGGMKIAPKADIKQTANDVIIVHSMPKILLLIIFISVYFGIHTIFKKYVTTIKGTDITIHYSLPQTFQTDGEIHENIQTVRTQKEKGRISFHYLDTIS